MSSKKRWNPDIKRHQRTRPEHMGEQNLTKEMINAMKTDEQTIALQKQINDMVKSRQPYKSFWTEENLQEAIDGYFEYCDKYGLETSPPSLRVWLNITHSTLTSWRELNDWRMQLWNEAMDRMEMLYFAKLDNKPVPQMFKLKTKFNYSETQKLDIQAKQTINHDNVQDLISKLGLDE